MNSRDTGNLPVEGSRENPAPHDRSCVRDSLLIALSFGGLALFYSFYLFAHLYHKRLRGFDVWYAPGDIWQMVDGGRYVWHGALGYVYQGTPSYALPLSFILTAPVSAVISHYNLIEGIFPIPKPTAWLVAGPFGLLFNIFLLDSVRRLAWDLGLRRRMMGVQLLTVLLVLVPMFEWGHFEDVIALTFVVHGARYLLRSDFLRAGLLVSMAVSSKQWAVMLIPLVVFLTAKGQRLRVLIAACALPVLFLGLMFAVDLRDTARSLFSPVNLGRNAPGHIAFFVTWLGSKTSAVSRALGLTFAPILAWILCRKPATPARLLLSMSLLLLIRPFSEAINYSYYWAPPLLMAALTGVCKHGRVRIRDWLFPILVVAWTLPHGNPNALWLWWGVLAALLVGTYLVAAANVDLLTISLPVRVRNRADSRILGSKSASSIADHLPVVSQTEWPG
jgi:hypothetical protein